MAGEATQHGAEDRQNGTGRKTRPEETPSKGAGKEPHHEAEHVFETVALASEPAVKSSEARPEAQAEPEAPRRKGWWQR